MNDEQPTDIFHFYTQGSDLLVNSWGKNWILGLQQEAVELVKASEQNARKGVATMTLTGLRHMRDNQPNEWDALVHSPEGEVMLTLWDYLRGIEGV